MIKVSKNPALVLGYFFVAVATSFSSQFRYDEYKSNGTEIDSVKK